MGSAAARSEHTFNLLTIIITIVVIIIMTMGDINYKECWWGGGWKGTTLERTEILR